MNETDSYRQHLATLDRQLVRSLELARSRGRSFESVLFYSGRTGVYHRDDRAIPFAPSGHFRRWVPSLDGPEHAVLARPGERPRVVRVRPRDYWYDTSPPPPSYWEEAVELFEVEKLTDARDALGPLSATAWVGPGEAAAELGVAPESVEPEELLKPLDWYRAYKTAHEVSRLEAAAEKAADGHLAARKSFKAWGSERQIHWDFLRASDQIEADVPYSTIVALDEKAAILHYERKRGPETGAGKVLLIDAGAAAEGYAIDVTRTWAQEDCDDVFLALVAAVDRLERELVAGVTVGRAYLEVHEEAYRGISRILVEVGILRTSVEEAVERRLTSAFFPHGVGHMLGLQVHDVGGHQAGPDGGEVKPPEEFPFLRNTRVVEPGHVVTVEPGLYFIEMLLDPLRSGEDAAAVDWDLVDRLAPHGGIRIEDNVLATGAGPRDLTRPLLAGPRGE